MCALAVCGKPKLHVCETELHAKERSYTYRTLEKLTRQYPMHRFYFIMGADSLDYFEEWKHPEIISALSVILVISRDHLQEDALSEKISRIRTLFPADIRIIHAKKYNISSHEIRERIAKGEDVVSQLPAKVLTYIQKRHLYQ